jgi:hypothetical protein
MNTVAIILGIVIIILFFVLYRYFTTTATLLSSSKLINLNVDQKSNAITKIDYPTNNQFSYGIWIYVNSWAEKKPKTIFFHEDVIAVVLDENSPILSVYVARTSGGYEKIQITDNFPLQKWVFIIVSMDTSFLDVYLDGKLIKSSKITNLLQPPKDPSIILGNVGRFVAFDAYVTCFYRWTVPMDPGTAWDYYMKGNGQGGFLGSMSPYGVKMQVLKNNVESGSYQLM